MLKRCVMTAAAAAVLIVLCTQSARAHKPLLAVEDNGDGTIHVEAGFSDGSSAAGHKIVMKESDGGKVLSEHRVGKDGTLEIKKPTVRYTVTLDAGPGHVVTVDGPPPDATAAKADVAPDKKPAPASGLESRQSVSGAAQGKPVTPPAAPGPPSELAPVTAGLPSPAAGISPGMLTAFKMMMITQIVTAVALIALVVIAAYYVGYTMGRSSGAVSRRKEV